MRGEAQEVVGHVHQPLTLGLKALDAVEGAAFSLRLRIGKVLSQQLEIEAERADVVLDLVDEAAGQFGKLGVLWVEHGGRRLPFHFGNFVARMPVAVQITSPASRFSVRPTFFHLSLSQNHRRS